MSARLGQLRNQWRRVPGGRPERRRQVHVSPGVPEWSEQVEPAVWRRSSPGSGRFVPRLAAEWDLDAPGTQWHALDTTLCLSISRASRAYLSVSPGGGASGPEELTEVLSRDAQALASLAHRRRFRFRGAAPSSVVSPIDRDALVEANAVVQQSSRERDVAWATDEGGRLRGRVPRYIADLSKQPDSSR